MQRIVVSKLGWINFISLIYILGRNLIKQYNGTTSPTQSQSMKLKRMASSYFSNNSHFDFNMIEIWLGLVNLLYINIKQGNSFWSFIANFFQCKLWCGECRPLCCVKWKTCCGGCSLISNWAGLVLEVFASVLFQKD